MKKFLIAAVVSTAFIATPAFAADTDSDSFTINASVEQACTMQGINDINLGDVAVDLTAGSNALLITGNTTQNGNTFWLSCNDTNNMTLVADPVMANQTRTLQPGDDAGFKDTINYGVRANNYMNSAPQPNFSSVDGYNAANGANRGAIHRQINMFARVRANENTDARPLAGSYSASVTVTVSTI